MNTNQQIREQLKNPNLTDAQRRKLLNQYDTAAGIQQRNPNAQIVQRGKIQKPTNTFKQLFSTSVGASVRSDFLNNAADKIDLVSRRFGAKGPTAFAQKIRQDANREMAHAYGHDARSWYNIANDNSMPLAMREDANNALNNRITQRQGLSQPGYIQSDWTGKDTFSRLGGAAVQGYMNDTAGALDFVDGVRAAWTSKFTKDHNERMRAFDRIIADKAATDLHRYKYATNYRSYADTSNPSVATALGDTAQSLIEYASAPLEFTATMALPAATGKLGEKAGSAVASRFVKPVAENAGRLTRWGNKALRGGTTALFAAPAALAPDAAVHSGIAAARAMDDVSMQQASNVNQLSALRQQDGGHVDELRAIANNPTASKQDREQAANIVSALDEADKLQASGAYIPETPVESMFTQSVYHPADQEQSATTDTATTDNASALQRNEEIRKKYTDPNTTPEERQRLLDEYNTSAGMDEARRARQAQQDATKPAWHSKYNWNMGDWFSNVNWQDVNSWLPGLLMALLGGGLVGSLSRNSWAALGSMPLFWGLTRGAQKNWGNIQQDLNIGNKGNNNVSK